MKDVVLYHGSKGGIKGSIKPISRELCDFGQGFYLGESKEQAMSIVSEHSNPKLYKIKLKLSEIPQDKILILSGKDWLYTVLSCRQRVDKFNKLSIATEWLDKIKNYDVIIGPIADDRMNEAMTRFSNLALTDEGLEACLKAVRYGNQYVLKSNFACSKAEIIGERSLVNQDLDYIKKYGISRRQEINSALFNASIKYRNKGLYLDQIIDMEKGKDIQNHPNKENDGYEI